jgi:hypothetical protein
MSSLSTSRQKQSQAKSTGKKKGIVESWEDELSSGEETETVADEAKTNYPSAPPPTPVSPTTPFKFQEDAFTVPYSPGVYIQSSSAVESSPRSNHRPEKTDAVAKRMVAQALGVRTPKKTPEQKEYERAMKEKEAKRRDREKEIQAKEKEDIDRAKAAIWED